MGVLFLMETAAFCLRNTGGARGTYYGLGTLDPRQSRTSWPQSFPEPCAVCINPSEEVNAVDVVQQVVEVAVDSGAAKSAWPIRKSGVTRTTVTKTVRFAAANGSPIYVEGDARLKFVRDCKKCNTKFLDVDVKISLASVSAMVHEGNIVVVGPQESYIKNTSIGQRIPMNRRHGVFVVQLDAHAGRRGRNM